MAEPTNKDCPPNCAYKFSGGDNQATCQAVSSLSAANKLPDVKKIEAVNQIKLSFSSATPPCPKIEDLVNALPSTVTTPKKMIK